MLTQLSHLKKTPAILLLGIVSAITLPHIVAAQDSPAPWMRLNIVHVDPTMVDEFIAIQREFTARAKEAKTPWRSVSRTEVFGDTYRFLIATPVENLASFDQTADSDPEMTALVNRVQRCVTSWQSYAVRTLPHIGNPLPEDQTPDLMVVNVAKVAPGREQDYLHVMTTDFLPHFDEAEVHHVTGSLAFGGEGGFIHMFYVDDFAELDKGSPVMTALGAEGAQAVTAKLAGVVTSSELWIVRVLPEVSYGASSDEQEP